MNTSLLAINDHDGTWFPFFPLIFFAIWIIVVLNVRRRWHHSPRHSGQSVLAERFARGEIDEA